MPVHLYGIVKDVATERILQNANVRERRGSNVKRAVIIETLQDLLNDGKARHHFLSTHRVAITLSGTAA